jgi:hypothetical protein
MIQIFSLRADEKTTLDVLHPIFDDPQYNGIEAMIERANNAPSKERIALWQQIDAIARNNNRLKRQARAAKIRSVLAEGGYVETRRIEGDDLTVADLEITGNRREGSVKVGDLVQLANGRYFVADDTYEDGVYRFMPLDEPETA